MGCIPSRNLYKISFALKLPSGVEYKYLKNNNFIKDTNINNWLINLFKGKNFKNWIVYNDQTTDLGINDDTKGHCKGILCWNNKTIGFLIHSVPNFPSFFDGNTISEINESGLLYGQNFTYLEFDFKLDLLINIYSNINYMNPNIYMYNNSLTNFNLYKYDKDSDILNINLFDSIFYISKSHQNKIDIYEDYICKKFNVNLLCQSWIRGSECEQNDRVKHIKKLKNDNTFYESSCNHSKFALSISSEIPLVFVGDLNRMTTQKTRGGSGMIIINKQIWNAFMNEIYE